MASHYPSIPAGHRLTEGVESRVTTASSQLIWQVCCNRLVYSHLQAKVQTLFPAADLVGFNDKNYPHLVAPSVPRVGLTSIFLREHLDVVNGAFRSDSDYPAADLEVA